MTEETSPSKLMVQAQRISELATICTVLREQVARLTADRTEQMPEREVPTPEQEAELAALRQECAVLGIQLDRLTRENVELHAAVKTSGAEVMTCWEMITRYRTAIDVARDVLERFTNYRSPRIWSRHGLRAIDDALGRKGEKR